MANHASHAALPYPIKGARYTILIPYLDADGDPTDPTTPDTEISEDDAAATDTSEEVASPKNSVGMLTLTGDETDCSCLSIAAKAASGPKTTLGTFYPRVLAVVASGTALDAGSSSGGTISSGDRPAYDITGCFFKTKAGTGGGGGSGSLNNQARRIVTYVPSTGAFTVSPNFETAIDTTTDWDVLLPEGVTIGMLKTLNPSTAGRTLAIESDGMAHADLKEWLGVAPLALTAQRVEALVGAMANNVITAASIAADAITAAKIQDAALTAAKFAAGAFDAVWTVATRTLTSFGTLVADIWANGTRTLTGFSTALAVSVWDVLESAIATASSIGLKVKNNLDAAVSTRSSHAAADVWAVGTRTLTAIGSSGIASQASVDDLPTNAELTTALAAADDAVLAAIAALNNVSSSQVRDAILAGIIEGSVTLKQSLQLSNAAAAGKLSGAATTTATLRNLADSIDRIVATVDADGNRTAVTRTFE